MSEKHGLDNNNPKLRGDVVNARLGRRTARRFQAYKHNNSSASVAMADEFISDVAEALGIEQPIAQRVIDLISAVMTDRVCDGKPCGFPGFGTIWVRTKPKKKRRPDLLTRVVAINVQNETQRRVSFESPLTEPFNVQYRKARKAYIERKDARKRAFISSGRRRRNRNDKRERETVDPED